MRLNKLNMLPLRHPAFIISLALVALLCHADLVHAQRAPRFRGLGGGASEAYRRMNEEKHKKYFSKIDVADSEYGQSLSDDAKSAVNQPWQEFLALPKTIRKLKVSVDRNANWTGTIVLLTNGDTVPSVFEITNDYVCRKLMSDLSNLPRPTNDAPFACRLGSIKICYDDPTDATLQREFEIGITDYAFTVGSGAIGVADTSFYSWPLSRVLSEAAKEQENNLTQLSFNILSGFNSLPTPVKFNARAGSAKLWKYWAQPADVWFTVPSALRSRGFYQKQEPRERVENKMTLSAWVDVKTQSDSAEEFQWFNEEYFRGYDFSPIWIGDDRIKSLLHSRFTFRSPADVLQCKLMGIINLSGTSFPDIDIFVTDKGFLAKFESQYYLFQSYDLAVWLDTTARERRSSISQKAFNVLSGIDAIVSRQQEFLGIDAKGYNKEPARTQFVAPEQLTNNLKAAK